MLRRYARHLALLAIVMLTASVVMLAATPTMAQDEPPMPDPLGEPPVFLTGIYEEWANSPHARFEDEAFRHWNEDGEIETACATCHSTPGYIDYLGADGSEAGVVDAPAPLGTVINCDACHNPVASELTEVSFPSGAVVSDIGDSTRCMVCHQGRASGLTVAGAIESAGLVDEPNTVSEDLRFINIHYYAAASSLLGSEVTAGYEFEGNAYFPRNMHVEGFDTCDDCHQPHTLELQINECATCHEGVETIEDVRGIRMAGSLVDFDGDGNIEEGVLGEIETLQGMLYAALQNYATNVVGTSIVYDSNAYPYFFTDIDGDGEVDEDEANYGNRYTTFTPRLLQATYNYQVSIKDHGGYAHNPKYHIELLYDTIHMINMELGDEAAVDLSMASRDSFGHFQFSAEAFRHWDEDGEVSARCSKCHTAEGLPFELEHGVTIAFEPSTSLQCTTCHDSLSEFTMLPVGDVTFPSGATISYGDDSANNICLECHQGRASGEDVRNAIVSAGVGDNEVSDTFRFSNPHYFVAAATVFGEEVHGLYEYEGRDYNGQFEHTRRFDECTDCHNTHTAVIRFEGCTDCHEGVESAADVRNIRGVLDADEEGYEFIDFDGDGNVDEGIASEIDTLHEALYEEMLDYAANVVGTPIVYGSNHPYWFVDTNGNGVADPDESARSNSYASWTPTLLRAAYNYQYVSKDPGAFAHNSGYVLQALYDTLADIGGDEAVASFTRPPVRD